MVLMPLRMPLRGTSCLRLCHGVMNTVLMWGWKPCQLTPSVTPLNVAYTLDQVLFVCHPACCLAYYLSIYANPLAFLTHSFFVLSIRQVHCCHVCCHLCPWCRGATSNNRSFLLPLPSCQDAQNPGKFPRWRDLCSSSIQPTWCMCVCQGVCL